MSREGGAIPVHSPIADMTIGLSSLIGLYLKLLLDNQQVFVHNT